MHDLIGWLPWIRRRREEDQRKEAEERQRGLQQREEWLNRKHDVIDCSGSPAFRYRAVRQVDIIEEAKLAVRELELEVFINSSATEPRWECWGPNDARAFGEDPNDTIIRCAASARQRRQAA